MKIDISIEWNMGRKKNEKTKQIRNKSIQIKTFDNMTSISVSSSEFTSLILGRLYRNLILSHPFYVSTLLYDRTCKRVKNDYWSGFTTNLKLELQNNEAM